MNTDKLASTSSYRVIGSCSLCGGPVEIFTGAWYGTNPPKAECKRCYATARDPALNKVIEMERGSFGVKP